MISYLSSTHTPPSLKKGGSKDSDADNFILTLMHTQHIRSRWYPCINAFGPPWHQVVSWHWTNGCQMSSLEV